MNQINRENSVTESDSSMIVELKNALQTSKREKEELEVRLEGVFDEQKKKEEELDQVKEVLKATKERYEQEINDLNAELRERLTPAEMANIKSILVTLQVGKIHEMNEQQIGIPVEFNETSDLPIPQIEAILLDKIQHLETSNSNLRSTFNEIYNKYMTSENEKHSLEERVTDQAENIKQMEMQIAQLEQRLIPSQATNIQKEGFAGNVEGILKDQRDRYKRRVDELEVRSE